MGIYDAILRRKAKAWIRGYQYEVIVNGEVVASSRDPEHAACRALLAKGFLGRIRFWREGKATHDSELDIEREIAKKIINDWKWDEKPGERWDEWSDLEFLFAKAIREAEERGTVKAADAIEDYARRVQSSEGAAHTDMQMLYVTLTKIEQNLRYQLASPE